MISLSIHLDGSPTWLPGARHIWMCALFGLPSALGPDPSSWRVVGRVSVVDHRVLRPKTHRKQAQVMVREDLSMDRYVPVGHSRGSGGS